MTTLNNLFAAFVMIVLTAVSLNAQNVWRGGAPGQEQEWSNPRNWSQNRLPDSDDMVLIPNTESTGGFYPVIKDDIGAIYYLEVQGGASLLVEPEGQLSINGTGKYEDAILLIGSLKNQGEIRIISDSGPTVAGHPQELLNEGGVQVFARNKQ